MKPTLWLCSALALSLLAACGSSATSKTAADVAVAADVSAADVPAADVPAADVASADVPLPGKATFETADPAAVVVLDANVMCSFCKNSDHPEWVQDWSARVLWWHDVILRHDPDLMALQEFQEIVPTDPVAPVGEVTGGCAGILKRVAQFEHLTFLPRAVSGTTKMLRHLRFGHMMRIFLTGPIHNLLFAGHYHPYTQAHRRSARVGLEEAAKNSLRRRPDP